jgi:hypothetical protein
MDMTVRESMGTLARGTLSLVLVAGLLLPAVQLAEGVSPKVEARTDRTPNPGENFTLIFTLTSYETANYTIQISPRPEFSFMDTSNGTRTRLVENGTTQEFNFPMACSRSAYEGTYTLSYSVTKDGATVKISTLDVKVGSGSSCSSFIILAPLAVVGLGAASWRRRKA